MPPFNHQQNRWPQNVRGHFYVDCQCTDCGLCGDMAPTVFARHDDGGHSYVAKQPVTADEVAQVREAILGCPHDAIHDDGSQFDWDAVPANIHWGTDEPPRRPGSCCH